MKGATEMKENTSPSTQLEPKFHVYDRVQVTNPDMEYELATGHHRFPRHTIGTIRDTYFDATENVWEYEVSVEQCLNSWYYTENELSYAPWYDKIKHMSRSELADFIDKVERTDFCKICEHQGNVSCILNHGEDACKKTIYKWLNSPWKE